MFFLNEIYLISEFLSLKANLNILVGVILCSGHPDTSTAPLPTRYTYMVYTPLRNTSMRFTSTRYTSTKPC
jgi:hypothetical protein